MLCGVFIFNNGLESYAQETTDLSDLTFDESLMNQSYENELEYYNRYFDFTNKNNNIYCFDIWYYLDEFGYEFETYLTVFQFCSEPDFFCH